MATTTNLMVRRDVPDLGFPFLVSWLHNFPWRTCWLESMSKNLREVMDGEVLQEASVASEDEVSPARSDHEHSSDGESSSRSVPRTTPRRARLLGTPGSESSHRGSPAASMMPPTCPDDITAGPTEVSRDMLSREVNSRWTDRHRRNWWKHVDESHRYTIGSVTYVYHQPKKVPVGEPSVFLGQDEHTYHILRYDGSDSYGYPRGKVPNRNTYPFLLNDGETKYSQVAASRRRNPQSDEESDQSSESEQKKPAARPSVRRPQSIKSPRVRKAYSETRPCRRTNPLTGTYMKKRRRKASTNAIRQIKQYRGKGTARLEKNINPKYPDLVYPDIVHYDRYRWNRDATRLLIPKAPFQRLVRDVCLVYKSDLRFTVEGMEALQTAAENHLVEVFEDANLCAIHAKRQTVNTRDIILATKIRKETVPECEERKRELVY